MSTGGIPESAPIGDGQPQQGGFGASPFHEKKERPPRRLLNGKDAVELTPPREGSLAILRECILRGVEQRLGVLKGERLRPFPTELSRDPDKLAEQLCSEVAALLQLAISRGMTGAACALCEGAKAGAEQGWEILDKLGLIDGEAGEVISQMFDAWGDLLARLVESVD